MSLTCRYCEGRGLIKRPCPNAIVRYPALVVKAKAEETVCRCPECGGTGYIMPTGYRSLFVPKQIIRFLDSPL